MAESRAICLESGRVTLWLRAKSLQDKHAEASLETLLIPTLAGYQLPRTWCLRGSVTPQNSLYVKGQRGRPNGQSFKTALLPAFSCTLLKPFQSWESGDEWTCQVVA